MNKKYLLLILVFFSHDPIFGNSSPAIAPVLPARSGSEEMTPEKLLEIPFSDLSFSKIKWIDNKRFLYQIPASSKENSIINLYNIDSRQSEVSIQGADPVPSPGGKWIALVRSVEKEKQLWIINCETLEKKQVTNIPGGITGYYQHNYSYAWSPDSKKIIFSHQDFLNPMLLKNRSKLQPITKLDFIDLSARRSHSLASFDCYVRYLSWIPKTEEILVWKERIGMIYNEPDDHEWIEALNVQTKQSRTLIKFDGLQQFLTPIPSHDGKTVALKTDVENPCFSFVLNLFTLPSNADVISNTNELQAVTHDVQLRGAPCWSADDQQIIVLRAYGPYAQLYKIDVATKEATPLTSAALNIQAYDFSPDGTHLAWIGRDAHGTYIVRMSSPDGLNVENLLSQNSLSKNIALSEVREITWNSDYPVAMRGLLVMPLHYQEGTKYPLVIDIHGGDEGACLSAIFCGGILCSTPLEWQLWTAKGYAVFVPELRSSGSFGSLAIRNYLQNHDRLNGDLNDIESGVNFLIERGIVDPECLAIFGHSAGGLRANWFEVSTHRYRAIVSHEGWADELEPALNWPPSKRLSIMYGGTPQEVPENYLKNSPSHFVKNATTPILFLMGNSKLGIDNYHTVLKFYEALENQGVDTKYHEYTDEGHLVEKPENRKNILELTTQWIDSHCH